MQTDKPVLAEAIARVNDEIRRKIPAVLKPHLLMLTDEVAALPINELSQLLVLVRDFNSFTEDNDPYNEHDFGKIDFNGMSFFWKIDYYDPELKSFQENGTRVVTVMFTHEY